MWVITMVGELWLESYGWRATVGELRLESYGWRATVGEVASRKAWSSRGPLAGFSYLVEDKSSTSNPAKCSTLENCTV